MKKNLQIFISSTYKDLQEERQSAVEAVLGSNNIPAGMELFKAGNKSQWETIKKWINESDIYMLILGGRYGSIETSRKKSYTQLEYEYAIEQHIPVFAVVLSDIFLKSKSESGECEVYESDNKNLYNEFKKTVMSKMIKEVNDCKDIKLVIYESIAELKEDTNFDGWIRGNNSVEYEYLIEKNTLLVEENTQLEKQLKETSTNSSPFRIEEVFWNQILNITIHVRAFDDECTNLCKSLSMKEILSLLGPGIMVPKQTASAKSFFEEILKEKYAAEYYIGYIDEDLFQTIKVQLYSKKIIQIEDYDDNGEYINLTNEGTTLLCDIKSNLEAN